MGKYFIITEEEKKQIQSLYEQKTEVQAVNIDDITTQLLPQNFVKKVYKELTNSQELRTKVNQLYNEKLPVVNTLEYLQSKGITPYLFIVPDYITGVGFPTTGLAVKIGNTPITVSMNLGTNPKNIPSSLKFSRISINLPLTK
jgi:hypothetical protein